MNALRLVFLLLAVGVLGLIGWRSIGGRIPAGPDRERKVAVVAPNLPVAPTRPSPPTADGDDRLADVPEFGSFYGRLRSSFPADYARLLKRLGRDRDVWADAVIWDALRDLQQSQGVLAAQAGGASLDRFFDARAAMLDGLAPLNAHQCADFLYGVTDASIGDFTASHRGLVATLADRTLDAIADGRAHHLDRVSPNPGDLDALSSGLAAAHLSPAEIGLLIDGTTPDPPPSDARLCEIGRAYLDVLRGLPPDARQRIYGLAAELLARS